MTNNTFGTTTESVMHRDDIMGPGHLACAGCGIIPMLRLLLKVFGRRTVVVTPACCYAVVDGPFPYSAIGVPFMHCAFETAAASAAGVRAAFDMRGIPDVNVIVLAGDGGTFDIGFQALSGAAERNENIVYVCYDNEAYMNTGIQRSSATPLGAWTTTTPEQAPKAESKKDIGTIMAGHRIPYFATTSMAYPEDMLAKFEKAKAMSGFRMIHYHCSCPTGWKADSRDMIGLARLAVQTRAFPLYEILDGESWQITVDPEPADLQEYFRIQGRYRHIQPNQLTEIERHLDKEWKTLSRKASAPESSGR